MQDMQKTLTIILQLSKDSNTDIRKLYLNIDEIKKEGVQSVQRLIKQVDSMNSGVYSSNNDLVITV